VRIAISGSSGFVGGAFSQDAASRGDRVVRLSRIGTATDSAGWDPATGTVDARALGSVDAVVHLAGENVAAGRWTKARKAAIHESRGPATERLCRSLASLGSRPTVLVSASAVGYYGDRGDEELDEASPPGTGFLADVVRAWEAATAPARDAGIRVVCLRIGIVLHPRGGALQRMLLPFRLGLGGRLGSGQQWMSWITLPDLVAAIRFAIATPTLAGAVNAVAPAPVTNREFTATLARRLHRPAFLPAPRLGLRLLFGELADEGLLASQRAFPRQLQRSGFAFTAPTLDEALRLVPAAGS
jgi:hypothetical protein